MNHSCCLRSKLLLAVSTLLRAALQIPSSDWGTAKEPRRKSSSVGYCRPSEINDKNAAINDKDAAINDKDAAVTDQSCTEIFKEIEMVSSYAALTVPDSHDRHLRGPQSPIRLADCTYKHIPRKCTGPMSHACTFSLFCNQIKSDHSQIIPSSVEKSWDTPTLG